MPIFIEDVMDFITRNLRIICVIVAIIFGLIFLIDTVYVVQTIMFTSRTADKVKDEVDKGGMTEATYIDNMASIGVKDGYGQGGSTDSAALNAFMELHGYTMEYTDKDQLQSRIDQIINDRKSAVLIAGETSPNAHIKFGDRVQIVVVRSYSLPMFLLPDNIMRLSTVSRRSAVNRGYVGFGGGSGVNYGYKKEAD